MSSRPDDLYLVDIIEASDRVASMILSHNFEAFEQDELLNSAVQYNLMIVGEACGRLQESTLIAMPNAPISQIRAFRNRIVHGYFSVDLAIVWEVATVHMPLLATGALSALSTLFPETHARLEGRRRSEPESEPD